MKSKFEHIILALILSILVFVTIKNRADVAELKARPSVTCECDCRADDQDREDAMKIHDIFRRRLGK